MPKKEIDERLLSAARIGDEKVAREALSLGANPNAMSEDGVSALARAAASLGDGVLQALLAAGADPNQESDPVALHVAASHTCHGRRCPLRLLLEAGADPNQRDEEGWTALMHAASWGQDEAARILIEAGADIGARNEERDSAEDLARKNLSRRLEATLKSLRLAKEERDRLESASAEGARSPGKKRGAL